MLEAQSAGYDLGANDPQLQAALQQRAAIAGAGIPTDAQGNPLVNEPAGWTGGGAPEPVATASTPASIQAPGLMPTATKTVPGALLQPGQVRTDTPPPPPKDDPLVDLTKSPYFMPTAIGAGALLLVLLLRR
jgi:hypothetical protein